MIHELIRYITSSLDQKGIPYMISGSLAFNMYCIPRMSMDIDLVIELNLSNLNDFLDIFKTGYYVDNETVIEEIKKGGMFNVIDHRTGFKIDFIVRKKRNTGCWSFQEEFIKCLWIFRFGSYHQRISSFQNWPGSRNCKAKSRRWISGC